MRLPQPRLCIAFLLALQLSIPALAASDAPAPPAVFAPGVSWSPPASLGGSIFGVPTRAAIETSGPFFKIPIGFVKKFERGRGVF